MDTEENPEPPKERKRSAPLKTIRHLRVFVAKTLRELKEHGVPGDVDRARCLIYGAKVLSEIIASTDIEDRLSRLEGRNQERGAVQ